jgi:hypothetical protein
MDQDPDAVAAHLRDGAVPVAVVHEPFGGRVLLQELDAFSQEPGRHCPDQAVGPDPKMPIAKPGDGFWAQVVAVFRIGKQDEVVACSVALAELEPP